MLLKMSALPVPGPCARRMMVPSSMFQSTSALISASSPCASSAAIQLRRSPKATGLRSTDMSSGRVWNMRHSIPWALRTRCAPSPACGGGLGWGNPGTNLDACPLPIPPPQAGEGTTEPRARWSWWRSSNARTGFALARGELDRVDDLRIGGAAAEIAREIMPYLILIWIGMRIEQLRGHQQEARRAVAALEGAGLDEGFLHRTEPVRARVHERLDGSHLGALDEGCQIEAAGDRRAVH